VGLHIRTEFKDEDFAWMISEQNGYLEPDVASAIERYFSDNGLRMELSFDHLKLLRRTLVHLSKCLPSVLSFDHLKLLRRTPWQTRLRCVESPEENGMYRQMQTVTPDVIGYDHLEHEPMKAYGNAGQASQLHSASSFMNMNT
jgi:hypothetical protein